jgi:hypothetical protein
LKQSFNMSAITKTIKTNTPKYEWFDKISHEKAVLQKSRDDEYKGRMDLKVKFGCSEKASKEEQERWVAFIKEFNSLQRSIPHDLDGHFWVEHPDRDGDILDPHFPVYDHIKRINKCSNNRAYYPSPAWYQKKQINKYIKPLHDCIKKHKLKKKDIINNPLFEPHSYGCNFNALVYYIKFASKGYVIKHGSMGWYLRHNPKLIHFEFEDYTFTLHGVKNRWTAEEYALEHNRIQKDDIKHLTELINAPSA